MPPTSPSPFYTHHRDPITIPIRQPPLQSPPFDHHTTTPSPPLSSPHHSPPRDPSLRLPPPPPLCPHHFHHQHPSFTSLSFPYLSIFASSSSSFNRQCSTFPSAILNCLLPPSCLPHYISPSVCLSVKGPCFVASCPQHRRPTLIRYFITRQTQGSEKEGQSSLPRAVNQSSPVSVFVAKFAESMLKLPVDFHEQYYLYMKTRGIFSSQRLINDCIKIYIYI